MARADQIYVMRELVGIPGQYEHHGIDCGDRSVIHYRKTGDEAVISRTSFEAFARGSRVYIKPQPLAFVPDVVLERAHSRLGERKYNLFVNNCEHFATWAKTGRSESAQLANFGLRLDQFSLPQLKQLIDRTAQDQSPETAIALFQTAIGDIATAYQTLQSQLQDSQHQADSWHQVAQVALGKGREDLARAALHRKVTAQKRSRQLSQQLQELVELQLDLLQHREWAEERFRREY